jgi:glycosyltransferase involved in cell wall biosynthesis
MRKPWPVEGTGTAEAEPTAEAPATPAFTDSADGPQPEAAAPMNAARTEPGTRAAADSAPSVAPGARPLRILQISHDLRPGGLQRVVIDLAQGLRRLGHDAHICSLRGTGPLAEEIRGRGIPLWEMPWPERGADRWLFLKVFRLLRQGRYDVVHTHNTQPFLDGGLAAALARVPVRIHTDHARPFPDKLRYMAMERVMSLAYRKVVGVSAHTAGELRRHEGIAQDKLAVIANGIDGEWYRAECGRLDRERLRNEAGLGRFKTVFGLGARLEAQKGIAFLLEAMPAILERHPDAALALAGSGSLEGELQEKARALGVAGNVRFLGSQPQLLRFYPMLDFLVLPSLWEGLPLCILEAMSLGLPIIATNVGGVGDALEDGRTARLVPPGDPAALAQAVTAFLDDPERARALGREGRRDFDARHDASVMVRAYLRLYGGAPA